MEWDDPEGYIDSVVIEFETGVRNMVKSTIEAAERRFSHRYNLTMTAKAEALAQKRGSKKPKVGTFVAFLVSLFHLLFWLTHFYFFLCHELQ